MSVTQNPTSLNPTLNPTKELQRRDHTIKFNLKKTKHKPVECPPPIIQNKPHKLDTSNHNNNNEEEEFHQHSNKEELLHDPLEVNIIDDHEENPAVVGPTVKLSTSTPEVNKSRKPPEKNKKCNSDKDYGGKKILCHKKRDSKGDKVKQQFNVSNCSELPDDIKRKIKNMKLDEDKINANFQYFIYILRYVTKDSYHIPNFSFEKNQKLSSISEDKQKKGDEFIIRGLKDKEIKKRFKSMESNGRGGFGRVFSARVKSKNEAGKTTKEIVAIKRLPSNTTKEQISNICEITCLLELRHSNIVQIKSAYQLSTEYWIIMEFMEGGTLNQAIRTHGLSSSHIYYISQQVLYGLEHIHSLGFAHRDLKSSNIMLSVDGSVKIIDFGLCADLSSGPRVQTLGTAYWMAPEIIKREPHTNKVDIWAFGIVFLEMFLRNPPCSSSRILCMFNAITGGILEWVQAHKNKMPEEAILFVQSCLHVDPNIRSSAPELLKNPLMMLPAPDEEFQSFIKTIFVSITLQRSGI